MQHLFMAAALAAATVIPASAQDQPVAPQEKPPATATGIKPVPLKLTVLLARFQGEKKISSLPSRLGCWRTAGRPTCAWASVFR